LERLVRPVSAAHRMTKPLRHTTILLAALVAAFAAAVATPAAQAAPAALEQTTDTCWLDVINDWLDNSQVDKTYAIPCYTQAIQHLNEYPDVKGYSSAIDDIQRAQLAAIHQERNNSRPRCRRRRRRPAGRRRATRAAAATR